MEEESDLAIYLDSLLKLCGDYMHTKKKGRLSSREFGQVYQDLVGGLDVFLGYFKRGRIGTVALLWSPIHGLRFHNNNTFVQAWSDLFLDEADEQVFMDLPFEETKDAEAIIQRMKDESILASLKSQFNEIMEDRVKYVS